MIGMHCKTKPTNKLNILRAAVSKIRLTDRKLYKFGPPPYSDNVISSTLYKYLLSHTWHSENNVVGKINKK